jgi:hypothetical protein
MNIETTPLDSKSVPTRSIVSDTCVVREHHEGVLVTYKGVVGYLLRYRSTCTHELLGLTLEESRDCLSLNSLDYGLTGGGV